MGRLVGSLFFAWLAVMALGIVIALLPVILYVAGFVLMLGLLALATRVIGSWFYY